MSKTKTAKVSADKETKQERINLKYVFTDAEVRGLGKDLAESQIRLRQLEDDRKRVADEWEAMVSALSNKVSSGYEYRDIMCEIALNDPVGKKTARRLDNDDVVWIRDLTDTERQRTLQFDGCK